MQNIQSGDSKAGSNVLKSLGDLKESLRILGLADAPLSTKTHLVLVCSLIEELTTILEGLQRSIGPMMMSSTTGFGRRKGGSTPLTAEEDTCTLELNLGTTGNRRSS